MIIDSNIIVGFFNKEDFHHKKAKEYWERSGKLTILTPILFESITVLQQRAGKQRAKEALIYLDMAKEKMDIVNHSEHDQQRAYELFITQKGSLSLFDTLIYTTAESNNIPFLTFDKKLNAFKP